MSNYKTVFDLMAGVGAGRVLRGYEASDKIGSASKSVDCCKMELESLGITERNIIAGLNVPDQFTIGGMEDGLAMNCMSVATADRSGVGLVNLSNTKEFKLHAYKNVRPWLLKAEAGIVSYSTHTGKSVSKDLGIVGQIKAVCSGMSDSEVGGLPMELIGERLSQEQDLRHMWMKMYLMLMDLNLSVVNRESKRRGNPTVKNRAHPGLSSAQIMNMVSNRRIVVNADGFTPEELQVLQVASQEYPFVKYTQTDNIYNSCHMAEDDLAIISNGRINIDTRVVWAPTELYRIIVSLAAKTKDLDGLFHVISMMRGRMGHIRDVMLHVEDRVVASGVPLSSSYTRALGRGGSQTVPGNFPSYIACSASLVADMMLGKCFELGATYLVENLGGYGDLVCGKGPAAASPLYNGLLRDAGVSDMAVENNKLMQQWESVSGYKYNWSISGGWKGYMMGLTDAMRQGRDFDLAQLTWDMAHSVTPDSAWGAVRKWTGYGGIGLSEYTTLESRKKAKDERNRLTACFTWAMGVRQVRPRILVNAYSAKEVSMSSKEMNWLMGGTSSYSISHVSYALVEEVQGREEWTEKSAGEFVRAAIDGRKCTMVMDAAAEAWSLVQLDKDDMSSEGTEAGKDIRDTLAITQQDPREEEEVDRVSPMVYRQKATDAEDKMAEARKLFSKIRNVNVESRVPIKVGNISKGNEGVVVEGSNPIEAIAEGLYKKGMLHVAEKDRLKSGFDGEWNQEELNNSAKLASGLDEIGIGLRLMEQISGGDHPTYREVLFREGLGARDEVVTLIARNGKWGMLVSELEGEEPEVFEVESKKVEQVEVFGRVRKEMKKFVYGRE